VDGLLPTDPGGMEEPMIARLHGLSDPGRSHGGGAEGATAHAAGARHAAERRPGLLALVTRAFEGGGAQRDIVLLANALAAAGQPIVILTLQEHGHLRDLLAPAIPVLEIAGGRIRYAISGLREAIGRSAPSHVLSSEAGLNLCALLAVRSLPARRRPKLVLREVASPSMALRHDPHRQNRIAYRALRYLYRGADRVMTLTEGARSDLMANFGVPAEKIVVARANAVLPADQLARLDRWDGESGREPGLIVTIGRLSPEKDQLFLLEAMARLRQRPDWRLAVIGDGPQRAALEAAARQLGLADRTTFTGHVSDPFGWMMRARLAVCSSRYEGLGNAVIEALACGTPVVSTDCPYGPREILQGGRYGTLVPLGDAGAMAAAIDAALDCRPDRAALMSRGRDYTADRAAASMREALAGL
jgi:glycosyltransferase involved in cell wall biosynthesis